MLLEKDFNGLHATKRSMWHYLLYFAIKSEGGVRIATDDSRAFIDDHITSAGGGGAESA